MAGFNANERVVFRILRDSGAIRARGHLPFGAFYNRGGEFDGGHDSVTPTINGLVARGYLSAQANGPALTANGELASSMLADPKAFAESLDCATSWEGTGHEIDVTPQVASRMVCHLCGEVFTVEGGVVARQGKPLPWELGQVGDLVPVQSML